MTFLHFTLDSVIALNRTDFFKTTFFLFLILGITILIFIANPKFQSINGLKSLAIVLGIFALPAILMTIEYLYYSMKLKIEINNVHQEISVFEEQKQKVYNFSDVIDFVRVSSYPIAENRLNFLPTDPFYYYKVRFRDNTQIIIPCLMVRNLRLHHLKITTQKKFFPFISIG